MDDGSEWMSVLSNIQSVDDTRNVTQDGQTDVDEEVSAASSLEEDSQWRKENGEEDFADITIEEMKVRTEFLEYEAEVLAILRLNRSF